MFLDRKDLTYIATVHFCGIQVGSLVDGSESMEDRNAKFVYLDFACESDIPAALHFARTTLVESTRTVTDFWCSRADSGFLWGSL